jgi:uncharacterized membrane protein YhaH (DUF805 family)
VCIAYYKNYRPMFTVRAEATGGKQLVMAGRLILGAWMVLYAANTLFLTLWPAPVGTEPLAEQLMTSLVNSRLLHVALTMQLLAGVLLLAGILVPLALCVQMSISTCALFWALILEQQPLGAALTLAAFALNGLLMLAYLPYYTDILQRRSVAVGEEAGPTSYDGLFVDPNGRTSTIHFIPAVAVVVAAIAFFGYLVTGRTADFCMLVLLYPLFTILTRRLRDMGQSPWLVLAPLALMLVSFAVWLGYLSLGDALDNALTWVALGLTAAFIVWGCVSADKTSLRAGS